MSARANAKRPQTKELTKFAKANQALAEVMFDFPGKCRQGIPVDT
jgi:hypothetical protein